MLFADYFLPSFPDAFAGACRVPLSGRYLDVESLGQLLSETLVGALLDAGSVHLTVRQRREPFLVRPAARLRAGHGHHASPDDSPEARVMRWLARESPGEAWLVDVFEQVVLPTNGAAPQRDACDLALLRLERAGVVVPLIRRVLQLNKMREHDVADRDRRALARVDEGAVRAMVACRARIAPAQLPLVREAWRTAVLRRMRER